MKLPKRCQGFEVAFLGVFIVPRLTRIMNGLPNTARGTKDTGIPMGGSGTRGRIQLTAIGDQANKYSITSIKKAHRTYKTNNMRRVTKF